MPYCACLLGLFFTVYNLKENKHECCIVGRVWNIPESHRENSEIQQPGRGRH